jgi:hypothetical protein
MAIRMRYGGLLSQTLGLSAPGFVTPTLAALLVVGGMAIGCLGGFIAARAVRTF